MKDGQIREYLFPFVALELWSDSVWISRFDWVAYSNWITESVWISEWNKEFFFYSEVLKAHDFILFAWFLWKKTLILNSTVFTLNQIFKQNIHTFVLGIKRTLWEIYFALCDRIDVSRTETWESLVCSSGLCSPRIEADWISIRCC